MGRLHTASRPMTNDADSSGIEFRLDAYLDRIGYRGPREATVAVLDAVHHAHVTHVTFENLDLMLGRPIRVDLASVQAKLVDARRGGYCFEQNTLLAAALRALGFEVDLLLARVRRGALRVLPRTHMVLHVHVGETRWLADAGFGADGLVRPAPLQPAGESIAGRWAHRVVQEAGSGLHVMQSRSLREDAWSDLYAFTLEPQFAVDIEMSNHYVSTHPDSRFVQTLTAQRATPERRSVLRNRELSIDHGQGPATRRLASREELLQALADEFGLQLPADAPLRIPD
jgi:N-hydroxyarylamine O-acetyltransferase